MNEGTATNSVYSDIREQTGDKKHLKSTDRTGIKTSNDRIDHKK